MVGILNDNPDSDPIKALLDNADPRDVSQHTSFDTGTYADRGTYDLGRDNRKIDYPLLSPTLFAKASVSGIFRKGVWPVARAKWEVYPEQEKQIHAAIDHHLMWCEIL